MLGKLAHQIAARNPYRQSQVLHGGGLGNGQRDPPQMRTVAERLDTKMHGREGCAGAGRRYFFHAVFWRFARI
jgi:hypothetical protein